MPTPRVRTWAPPVAVSAAGAAVPAALAAASLLPWAAAAQLGVLWVLVVAVAALLAAVRRILHRLGALGRLGPLEQGLGRVEAELPVLREEVRALGDRLEAGHRADTDRITDHVTAQGRRDYAQAAAWQELREFVRPGPFMPALRDWAASPDVLCLLVEQIRRRTPALVVECGSGASSVWLGYALRRMGKGRLVALEHDERYAALSRDLVAAHGLGDIVEVRTAPLQDWSPGDGGPAQPWYDIDALTDLVDIDLVFVDGPPARTAPEARYPAGPVLLPRCAPGAVVLLDDTVRAAERRTSDRWLAAHPDFERTVEATEKGTHVLTRH